MKHVNALEPAVVPADFQPLSLGVEQEDAFVAEYPPIHMNSTAQEMLNVLEPDRTESGKADHQEMP